ncbi:carboxyl-terminal processing protease [Verrucomicrobium sp. GAS474]|uniref:S41 family peptidase n=1 Tax=Verrucomicrobium sp. GAS474 TaxID=1882831 RepID=UPI00087D0711|nr:S41 family peptidase [Verrucomicrobium sp. GAS474]SDU09610.1 carboxyl-terminal processing protease [Verrucomicrobium sp. GAS474]
MPLRRTLLVALGTVLAGGIGLAQTGAPAPAAPQAPQSAQPAAPVSPPAPAPATAVVDDGSGATPSDEAYQATLLFTKVIKLIGEDYVNEAKTGYKDLVFAALKGMLSSLDPHSQFLDEDAFAEMQKDTKGEFAGLGLSLSPRANTNELVVVSSYEDTPSFRAGIMPGDRILKINDLSTERMPYAAALKALKGKRGEKVRLTLYRPSTKDGEKADTKIDSKTDAKADQKADQKADPKADSNPNIYEVELTREIIRISSVRAAKLLPPEIAGEEKIGYLRIEQFGENTASEFDKAVATLKKGGMRALVVDLRNNPGGLIDSAVEIAGAFVPPGQVIVSTQGRRADSKREYRSHRTQQSVTVPVALLINGYSASGSEIVAGALQDYHAAVLVGERTFGKGSVQSVINLGNGVGVRLTTAKYYTPNLRVIHEKGVDPDIPAPVTAAEERNLIRFRTPVLLTPEEKMAFKDFHDTQLERSVDVLRARLLRDDRQKGDKAAPPVAAPGQATPPVATSVPTPTP